MEKQRKPRVLLTGFTPFGGERINPALEAVNRVRCPEAEVRVLEVPTVFGESSRVVTAAMDAFRPDEVLCFWRIGGVFRYGTGEGHGPGHPGGRGAVGAVQQRGDICVQPPAVLRTAPCRSGSPGGVHPCALHPGADGGHRSPLPAPGAAGRRPGGGGCGLL